MSLDTLPEVALDGDLLESSSSPLSISLSDFVSEFGDELLDSLNRANHRSTPARRERIVKRSSPILSDSCFLPRPKSSMP
jgi:hypothetical protein